MTWTRRQWIVFAAVTATSAVAGGGVAFLTYVTLAVIRADEERQRG